MRIFDFGPFATSLIAMLVPAGIFIAFALGLQIDLSIVLWVLVPAMALAMLMVAVSMAWIFILIGRLKRQPRWMPGTVIANGIAMIEMLVIVILTTRTG